MKNATMPALTATDYLLMIARADGPTLVNLRTSVRAEEGFNTIEREELEAAMNRRFGYLNHEALKHQKPRWHGAAAALVLLGLGGCYHGPVGVGHPGITTAPTVQL